MLVRAMAAMAACAALGACGGAETSFDDSFNAEFHKNFIASCVGSATKAGVTQEMASKLCTCASDTVKDRYSTQQKMALKEAELKPIIEECRASIRG